MEQVQDKIERAKQELEQMIDLNPQVMLLADREGRITRANRALLDLLGLPGYPEVLGKRIEELFPGKEAVRKLLARRKVDKGQDIEVRLRDGRARVLHFTVVGAGAKGELSVVVINDVGADRERAAFLELKHKKDAVNTVAGALMHNVNQSLTVIMVNAQLMNLMVEKGQINAADVRNSLQDIVKETTRIAEVLKDIDRPAGFVMEPYLGSVSILDIKRSAGLSGGTVSGPAPRAYLWLESAYASALDVLLSALDVHDNGVLLHARRTATNAEILARRMGKSETEAVKIRNCAALHDIGKLGIPDSILCKPAPLTAAETACVRTHTEIGYDLLRNFPFAREEAEAARSHHERWDGSGYPQGLAGKDIHEMARIVGLADAVDALSFDRAYHKGVSPEAIAAEINSGAGVQFDPEVVAAFNNSRVMLRR